MRSLVVLDMIETGRIEELKALLRDEIYQESLKKKPTAKKRYTAMKRYFTYVNQSREILQKPCAIEFNGKAYTCFTNSWSLALTTEDTGEIPLYDESNGKYPDISRLIRFDGIKKKIDFNEVIARAKSQGYRLTKKEVNHGFRYLMLYDGTYYKIGLLDATYSIIDDGEPAMTYHPDGEKMPLTVETNYGLCILMPVHIKDKEDLEENYTIIEVGD